MNSDDASEYSGWSQHSSKSTDQTKKIGIGAVILQGDYIVEGINEDPVSRRKKIILEKVFLAKFRRQHPRSEFDFIKSSAFEV